MYNEVGSGVTRFKVHKRTLKRDSSGRVLSRELSDTYLMQYISEYGLGNYHVPLLQGITVVPKRRTELLGSLGPLAQCILMVITDEDIEISRALRESLKMLPMSAEIISCLKNTSSSKNGLWKCILKELSDILMIATPRGTQKSYMPLLLSLAMWKQNPAEFQWSYSGEQMRRAYTDFASKATFRIRSGASPLLTAEIIFHAMFGTYLDDLSVLSQITTNSEWHQRKDMDTVFERRADQEQISVKPITFKYVPEMAERLFFTSLINQYSVGFCMPVFSGFRTRVFTKGHLAYLRGERPGSYSSDPSKLLLELKEVKESLVKEFEVTPKVIHYAGTKKWKEHKDGVWIECDFVPTESNVKFFGI